MSSIQICRYSAEFLGDWNHWVSLSKNGTFLFQRDYMDYHADRFEDHSLIFKRDNKLIAILPANQTGNQISSHGGLSYGGLVTDSNMTTPVMLELVDALGSYMKEHNLKRLIYKAVPWFYHQTPASEDLYALHLLGAKLYRRDVSTTVDLRNRLPIQTRRERGARKAKAAGVTIRESQDLESFWQILAENLSSRHGVNPTHSASEIRLLASRFSGKIRLFGAFLSDQLIAGTVIFETTTVAHAQYISTNSLGRQLSAMDLLFSTLLDETFATKLYFDFGISTTEGGRVLNRGLIEQKEGFGGRATVHDFYQWEAP